MQAQVEELGDSKVRLTVEVPSADVKHAVEHAASDLAESAKIPGFRKGKVPLPVLVQRIGKRAPLRGGGREPHRRLVLERRGADAHPPGRPARVRLRAPDDRRAVGVHRDRRGAAEARAAGLEHARGSRRRGRGARRARRPGAARSFRRRRPISRRSTTVLRSPATCSCSTSSCADDARRDYAVELGGGTARARARDGARRHGRRGEPRRSRFPSPRARRAPSR